MGSNPIIGTLENALLRGEVSQISDSIATRTVAHENARNDRLFRLKKEYDPTRALGFGLIAEEVEKVDPAPVYRNVKGQVESVRYEMVNAMLLNEFLKEHRKNEKQEATIAELKAEIGTFSATVKAQAEQIQKVTAQLELSKAAP
jgi:hypothetical protein